MRTDPGAQPQVQQQAANHPIDHPVAGHAGRAKQLRRPLVAHLGDAEVLGAEEIEVRLGPKGA